MEALRDCSLRWFSRRVAEAQRRRARWCLFRAEAQRFLPDCQQVDNQEELGRHPFLNSLLLLPKYCLDIHFFARRQTSFVIPDQATSG
jgi:hypothetical protein